MRSRDRRRVAVGAALAQGFTLVELIIVIILVGALAVFVAPRLLSISDFNVRGLHDETLGLLRYAQKAAVAQRRTVCVAFSASGVTLTIAAAAGSLACGVNLVGPRGDSPGSISGRSGAGYASVPADFKFDALGQPRNAAGTVLGAQTIQVAGAANTITVEGATGYVHD